MILFKATKVGNMVVKEDSSAISYGLPLCVRIKWEKGMRKMTIQCSISSQALKTSVAVAGSYR